MPNLSSTESRKGDRYWKTRKENRQFKQICLFNLVKTVEFRIISEKAGRRKTFAVGNELGNYSFYGSDENL